jgi:hypothetical protein
MVRYLGAYLGAASAALAILSLGGATAQPFADPRAEKNPALAGGEFMVRPRDAACNGNQLTSTGGPAPHNPHTLSVRWTGFSNYELV